MKKFRDILKEARPQDYKVKPDDDEEVIGQKPRSKEEEDFRDDHEVEKKDHPVADDNQFTSSNKPDDHKGHKKGKGEEAVKQGTSNLSKFMNKSSGKQTPQRKGDKRQGDLKPVMAKEETLYETGVMDTLKNIVKKKKTESVKFRNGKTLEVDPRTAGAIVKLGNDLNGANLRKLNTNLEKGEASFMKMVDFAMG
jgi:hypothetical protein